MKKSKNPCNTDKNSILENQFLSKSASESIIISDCTSSPYLNQANSNLTSENNSLKKSSLYSNVIDNKKSTVIKPVKQISPLIYLLSTLFIFQLALISFGFYLQYNYLMKQNSLFEVKINAFLNNILDDFNTISAESPENTDDKQADFMILNLTHPIDLKSFDNNVFDHNLFNSILNKNINSRLKRSVKKSPSLNQNNSNNYSKSYQDVFLITPKQPKNISGKESTFYPNPGDHFLIQAYSKISVKIFF